MVLGYKRGKRQESCMNVTGHITIDMAEHHTHCSVK